MMEAKNLATVVHPDKTVDSSYRIKTQTFKFPRGRNKLKPEVYEL